MQVAKILHHRRQVVHLSHIINNIAGDDLATQGVELVLPE